MHVFLFLYAENEMDLFQYLIASSCDQALPRIILELS